MSIHPSWKWHTEEPRLFPHGATRTCLQMMEEDSCAQNALGAAHSETQCWLHTMLQGGPCGAASSTSGHWEGGLRSHLCRSQIHLLQGDNQCQPLRRRLGRHRTPAVTFIKATHYLHVTGKVHLALHTAPDGEIPPPEEL